MMKCAVLLVLVGLSASTCPTLTCTDYLSEGLCGYLDETTYLIKPCAEGMGCPLPGSLNDTSLLVCEQKSQTPALYLHELNPTSTFGFIRHEGESCYGSEGTCLLEENLVCACSPDCTCVQGGQPGDSCATTPCAWGSSCLSNTCTKWFSQSFGTLVPDKLLCEAMEVDDTGACIREDTNSNDIFEPCESDSDCVGTQRTRGHCQCGGLGLSYCALKPGDAPFSHLKTAYLEKSLGDILYWRMVIDHWAFLQRNDGDIEDFREFPACVDEVWPEVALQLRALPALVDISSAVLLTLSLFLSH